MKKSQRKLGNNGNAQAGGRVEQRLPYAVGKHTHGRGPGALGGKGVFVGGDLLAGAQFALPAGPAVHAALEKPLINAATGICANITLAYSYIVVASFYKAKARHPQTNGICELFHKTILNEFYRVWFRRKLYQPWKNCRLTWMTG